ncbi:hypothetical protein [Nonomuraea basaltis]|uniref:hypothetical protein n=1 Tax=Nonomuraea basaltis TaxID=2495887 RepID=UPI00110C4FE9|nr:hypothetical protein [Nonomuraea basaltis]TMR88364.1 hypothetical protein EJK15_66660 [Nonomuraea basaltis]
MSRLNFDFEYANGITHARLIAEFGQGVIERHWTGLYALDYPDDPQHNPFFRYGVNNSNQEEVAVYLGLAWAFTAGRHRFVVPTWARDEATRYLGRHDYDFITWEYEIDAEQPDWPTRDRGFVASRNMLSIRPAPTDWQRAHRHEAGLFPARDLRELTALTTTTLMDVDGNVNLFGLAGLDRKDRLLDSLRGQLQPELATLLAPGDVFVDITIGCDLGTYDSVLAVASGDHRHTWQAVIDEYRRRVHAYENAIDSFHTFDDLFSALAALQLPVNDTAE